MNKSIIILIVLAIFLWACNSKMKPVKDEPVFVFETNVTGKGVIIETEFLKGKEHNHPLFAFWVEDTDGNYIQTLYVSKSIATSTFERAENDKGKWETGIQRRPAALPYWSHKRGIIASDGLYLPTKENPVPDVYTGATPPGSFKLITRTDELISKPFRVLLEINQSWDWNDYWHNDKFPGDKEYATSSQPSLIYSVIIDPVRLSSQYEFELIGHGHHSGKDGSLNTDLTTISTAKNIAKNIRLTLRDRQ